MDVKRTSQLVEGFGSYEFDTDVFAEAMKLTVAQLRERVQRGCEGMESGTRTKVSRLRKADLAAMVAEWDTGARDNERHADESVNEEVDGVEVATRWLNLDPSYQTETPEQMANRLAEVPSPQRDYQSSQEALAVLEEHNPTWVGGFPPVAEVPEPADDGVDPEFAAEVDALIAADLAPETTRILRDAVAPLVLPITETDVQAANVDVVVQLRKRLYNGKLIAVVNRRTMFSNPICATVEVGGVRFLVNADDLLAA